MEKTCLYKEAQYKLSNSRYSWKYLRHEDGEVLKQKLAGNQDIVVTRTKLMVSILLFH